ncbi:unnamed protein product [Urochloa decumbens]|uniref:Protein kinase domain-containing protein n=1 Tax=Urochloa decumbens TaxID=240449 RepID=A0ABC9F1E2_9POAL
MEPEELTYKFLREITDDFSEERKIGQGGFGTVYKGVTKTGVDVAVKIPRDGNNPDLDFKQFQNEFDNLTKVKHVNIVQFLGYCYEIEPTHIECSGRVVRVEKTHRALCFEYLHNGSLQNHLSDESCGLDWHTWYQIIKGTCEGLRYIHEEESLLHLDLKPDNILLDKDMMPKIADFGLFKIFGDKLTRTTKSPLGTLGYQPPEFIEKGEISEKFDIFSLGVIIIRILSGLNGYSKYLDMTSDEFIGHVQTNWKKRCLACSNCFLLEACYYCRQVETCTQIALDCLEKNSRKRPDIVKIIDKLKEIESDNCKETQILQPPKNGHNMLTTTQNELELIEDHHVITSVGEELIVGRHNEKKKIMSSLLEKIKSEKIVILPIYGIGGIGKTTLAKLIYNDANFKYFSHVWVYLSQRFSLDKIDKLITLQLSGNENKSNEQLISKEILIVLDDLWEDKPLEIEKLKDMLSTRHSIKRKIVLVTTRSADIAKKICCNIDEPYQIESLTDEMCWDIIKQKSVFEAIPEKEKLEDIGKKIAQKCGGVALAAQTLGSMLHSMEYNGWIRVRDNSIWKGSISKDASLPQHVLASLKLSYDLSLDDSLKKCFTYCAIFPKGCQIFKYDLIYQWISLDFIKPSKMLSTLQLCENYIVRLLGLSFLQHYSVRPQVRTYPVYGEHDTVFKMHDLVHDLAVSLLGDKILDQSNEDNTGGSSSCYALLADCRKPLEPCMTFPAKLSALRFLRGSMTELHGAAFEPAESLRVLDLSECEIQKFPDSIGQLKQLRYLKAAGIKDRMVPECITKLTKLQYLNLANCNCIGDLPRALGRLTELEYLNLRDDLWSRSILTEIQFSGSLGLTKLQYLDLASRDGIIRLSEAVRRLTGLKYLNLSHHFIMGESLESFFGNLCDLVHLDLSYCYSLGDMRAALNGLTKLQYLNLYRCSCFVSIEGLQELFGNLSELRDLNLGCCIGKISSSHPAKIKDLLGQICTLTNLESLSLCENNNICSIPETLGNLRKLHTLDLSYCNSLERLPASISEIHSLKCLKTEECWMLDRSTLPQYKRSSKTSPHIGLPSQLDYEIPDRVNISSPENVKLAKEAVTIKLVQKTNITGLTLEWSRDEKRFVDNDPEVLRELDKRYSVSEFHLEGYNSVSLSAFHPG